MWQKDPESWEATINSEIYYLSSLYLMHMEKWRQCIMPVRKWLMILKLIILWTSLQKSGLRQKLSQCILAIDLLSWNLTNTHKEVICPRVRVPADWGLSNMLLKFLKAASQQNLSALIKRCRHNSPCCSHLSSRL